MMKRWKHRGKPLLIPIQHEPGEQRGYRESKKGGSPGSSSPGGRGKSSSVKFWPIGRWADGVVK